MINGRDIICFASIEWNYSWQGPQEIATRLARAGNRVLYVENTGIRAPRLQDADRVVRRVKLWTKSRRTHGVQQIATNLYVCSPLVLPPFGSKWRRQINRRLLLPKIKRAVRDLGMRDPVLLTFLPTDTAFELLRMIRTPRSVVVYYYVDNFSLLTPHKHQLQRSEKVVMRESDLIFTTCAELAAHCEPWREKVHIFPYGVNLDAFSSDDATISGSDQSALSLNHRSNGNKQDSLSTVLHPTTSTTLINPSNRETGSPVIGYIGSLHRFVDYDLLVKMALARPDWSWVFVGAFSADVSGLAELPNVQLLGNQPHNRLAQHIRSFDVCLIPYKLNDSTNTVVPTKLNEYLAVGKSVVSTKLPSVLKFNETHKQILSLADAEPNEFLQAIEQCLNLPPDEETIARRRRVAALADWQSRLESMSQLIEKEIQLKDSQLQTHQSKNVALRS